MSIKNVEGGMMKDTSDQSALVQKPRPSGFFSSWREKGSFFRSREEELGRLEKELKATVAHSQSLEKKIASMLPCKEGEKEAIVDPLAFEALFHEKEFALEEIERLKRQQIKLKALLKDHDERKEALEKELHASLEEVEKFRDLASDWECQWGNLYKDKEELEREVERLKSAIPEDVSLALSTLKDKLSQAEGQIREKEDAVREAQQHLAKKVKETALATSKFEEFQGVIDVLREDLERSRRRVDDRDRALKEAEGERRESQIRVKEWEDKYQTLFEEHQKCALLLKNLKSVLETSGKEHVL